MRPDKTGFVTGGADKTIKFWSFDLLSDPNYSKSAKRLSIVLTQTITMEDEVLCVKFEIFSFKDI